MIIENKDFKKLCIGYKYGAGFKYDGNKVDVERCINKSSRKYVPFYPNLDVVYAIGDLLILKDGDQFLMFYRTFGNFDRVYDICSIEQNEVAGVWNVTFLVDRGGGETDIMKVQTVIVTNPKRYKASVDAGRIIDLNPEVVG